ncbi:MAG: DUF455 family protein [Planctomycetaceae bacterium]
MELRAFAEQVLLSESLDQKIQRPEAALTDVNPGPAVRITVPARPENLQFAAQRTAPAMPKGQAFSSRQKRAVAHHIMANHELQALEVMAMILLAFPDADPEFRMGVARIMFDEQRHTRLHVRRAAELGLTFGDLPINSYIWTKAQAYESVLEYVAGLPLVFEGANLDHTVEFEEYFLQHDDPRGAEIMRAIHLDEIQHVEFGLTWLRKLKDPGLSDFEAWQQALKWPIKPGTARGERFQMDARIAAGMTPEFLEALQAWSETKDGGPG